MRFDHAPPRITTPIFNLAKMIPRLLDVIAALNLYTILWSACLVTGIFLLLPRRQ